MSGKYYDQRCPDCDSCGWFGKGEFPDGTPYDRCGKYGYILHEKVDMKCGGFMTAKAVAEYMRLSAKKKRK